MILPGVEYAINLIHIIDPDTMRQHGQGISLALANHLQQGFPVQVDGSLAVADETDPALHESTNVEVVGLEGKVRETQLEIADVIENLQSRHKLR